MSCSFSIFLGYKSSPSPLLSIPVVDIPFPPSNRHLRKPTQIYEKHRCYAKVREFQDAATVQHMQITPSTFFGCSSHPILQCMEWPPKIGRVSENHSTESSVCKLDHDGFVAQILRCQEFLLLCSLTLMNECVSEYSTWELGGKGPKHAKVEGFFM